MANHYRCKHTVEAMRWDGNDAIREWHEQKTGERLRVVSPFGVATVLLGDAWHEIAPGEWLIWSSGEFLVMDDEQFRETYEPANPSYGPIIP